MLPETAASGRAGRLLTPGCPGGGGRRAGGGGGAGSRFVPGKVVGGVVGLAQRTLPPVVQGVLVRGQPVLVLDVWVPVCGENLHTCANTSHRLSNKGP